MKLADVLAELAGGEVTGIETLSGGSSRELIGFEGRVFHEWDRFVAEGGFDACSVCSPPEVHAANVRDLAEAGKDILCEKPLVWNWGYRPEEILAEARSAVAAADRADSGDGWALAR